MTLRKLSIYTLAVTFMVAGSLMLAIIAVSINIGLVRLP